MCDCLFRSVCVCERFRHLLANVNRKESSKVFTIIVSNSNLYSFFVQHRIHHCTTCSMIYDVRTVSCVRRSWNYVYYSIDGANNRTTLKWNIFAWICVPRKKENQRKLKCRNYFSLGANIGPEHWCQFIYINVRDRFRKRSLFHTKCPIFLAKIWVTGNFINADREKKTMKVTYGNQAISEMSFKFVQCT